MVINGKVAGWMSTRIGGVLSLFVVMVAQAKLLAQDEVPVPTTPELSRNDPELLNLIIARSRANLCKIQDWRGRARIRWEAVRQEETDGEPIERAATGVVTFVYNLNRAEFHTEAVLEETTNLPKGPPGYLQNERLAKFRRFSPVCWQFPMKENIIGSSFKHFYKLLIKEEKLPEGKVTRTGSIVRFWIGPSEDTCNVYEIDLDKGACLVHRTTVLRGKVTATWKLEPQLVDDIWIPRKTTKVSGAGNTTETIDWFENEIK